MTLGRLMELYQAEQQGKQIMLKIFDLSDTYSGSYEYYPRDCVTEVKLADEELKNLVLGEEMDEDGKVYRYFIKDEENEYGDKLNKNKQ